MQEPCKIPGKSKTYTTSSLLEIIIKMLALWDYSVNSFLARKNTHVWPVNAPLINLKFAKWRLCHWFKKWKSHWFWPSTWKKMREFEEWLILLQFFGALLFVFIRNRTLEEHCWYSESNGRLATFLDTIWHGWLYSFLKTPSSLGFGVPTLLGFFCLFLPAFFGLL